MTCPKCGKVRIYNVRDNALIKECLDCRDIEEVRKFDEAH